MTKKQLEQNINEDGGQMGIIFNIPTNTVKLDITATVIDDKSELHQASTTINLPEIYEARILGNEWETENIKYCLTEEGRKAVEQIKKEQGLL